MLNSVVLMGRLTADPEARTTASNLSVTTFTLAVERNYANKQNGERTTDFIDIVAWRSTADFVVRYFKKGQLVAVQGSLQVRSYEDKDGNKRRVYEVQADQVFFAEPKRSSGDSAPSRYYDNPPPEKTEEPAAFSNGDAGDFTPIPDDDLPF
ncbi:MAG: single-stranded DNA-binding protein [Clostridia bacterium]|nr:single-stranded DNA-binding protein [Oscillospiraceae bacterium]MBQ6796940.1 single-stranded DNA-binding protein [Clostridia bacterium]